MSETLQSRKLVTTVTDDGQVVLSLQHEDIAPPAEDEILVRVEAAPINPSDMALLFGPGDFNRMQTNGDAQNPVVSAPIPPNLLKAVEGRIGQQLGVGNECAGTVVSAGASEQAQALVGKTVSFVPGEAFAQYCCVKARMVLPMEQGITPREAASSFVNPMTVLGMVETMRDEGFAGIIHTASASNLGQMLNRVCQADGIPLINIVRKPEQEQLLRDMGAEYVINSSSDSFKDELTAAITETGIYLAFDATGGGRLANDILTCMERAASAGLTYNRYGSDTQKKVYIYGRLDLAPLELNAAYGFAFSVSGWLLTYFLQRIGMEKMAALQQRVASEIRTTFASDYSAEISLEEALSPEMIAAYGQRTTGQKYLINPHKYS